jgi:hypothetical protein
MFGRGTQINREKEISLRGVRRNDPVGWRNGYSVKKV